ncbi:MAG: beta-galactosidase GalB [Bacteroides sp.]|nr:beta-galactosidase GalB [Bacteroides sp.]
MKIPPFFFIIAGLIPLLFSGCNFTSNEAVRQIEPFNLDWKFSLGDFPDASQSGFNDDAWRRLSLPHDWSIEGAFSKDHPSTAGGGALPGGIGWYRKTFTCAAGEEKKVFIEFDGIYQESEVWINGSYLGKRPNGYISFSYELSPHLHRDGSPNLIAVRVNNSQQPNSRWYSGSGIYREVRLVVCDAVHVAQWGTYIRTPEVNIERASVSVQTEILNQEEKEVKLLLRSVILNPQGKKVSDLSTETEVPAGASTSLDQQMEVDKPELWSPDHPLLYTMKTEILMDGKVVDRVSTPFGIRHFEFDAEKGFFLNGESMKIKGVCNHHDLGALGAAAYPRAMERQLELLKAMGCNAIRTSHNPPAPSLLDLCDRMGFLVMDETFDMWKKSKSEFDYSLFWDDWHERDLKDHILRDRNHPSVIIWSIGNEILEQWDDSGEEIAIHLAEIVRELDPTRPIVSGCNETSAGNSINRSGAMDLIGFNYHHEEFKDVSLRFPGMPFIATETTSALATRGYYDLPSDKIRIWPKAYGDNSAKMNAYHSCSAYDNCHVPWGSTHEAALLEMKNNDFISGMFVWTGFDYLGEPTPYGWPSRSSYFGILDLAGFPKDAYYLYQSQWTKEGVLHLFPHWNWETGDTVDVWAYSSCPELELFLNGKSMGIKSCQEGSLHMQWRLPFEPGVLEAKGLFGGKELSAKVETAGEAAGIRLLTDRSAIRSDQLDLAFLTVEIIDAQGRLVPDAGMQVGFSLEGEGEIIAVDNGLQTSMEAFKATERKAFNGKCLAIVRSSGESGRIEVTAEARGLNPASLIINVE